MDVIPNAESAADAAGKLEAAPKIRGVHHSAFRCRDAEETRKFYEEVLGLPLKATVVADELPGSGEKLPYMHLFFEMGDGNYIAFFDIPDGVKDDMFGAKWGMELHFAMEAATMDELMAFKARLESCGVPCFGPIDHHFCHSIYFWDPNGLALEITTRDAEHDGIMTEEAERAHEVVAEWTAKTAAKKAEALGAPQAAE